MFPDIVNVVVDADISSLIHRSGWLAGVGREVIFSDGDKSCEDECDD